MSVIKDKTVEVTTLILIVNFPPLCCSLQLMQGYESSGRIGGNFFLPQYTWTHHALSICTDMRHFCKLSVGNRIKCLQHTLGKTVFSIHLLQRIK